MASSRYHDRGLAGVRCGRHPDRRHGNRKRRLNPTGTVTFNLYAPGDTTCDRRRQSRSSPPPIRSSGAHSATSLPFTPTTVGIYNWVATYGGDANKPVSSACGDEPVTIDPATPTIATDPSAGGVVGTSISDTATISGGVNPHRHGHLHTVRTG